MSWLLVIVLIMPSGEVIYTPVGHMVDEAICDIGGSGYQAVLQAEDPTIQIAWTCTNLSKGASA